MPKTLDEAMEDPATTLDYITQHALRGVDDKTVSSMRAGVERKIEVETDPAKQFDLVRGYAMAFFVQKLGNCAELERIEKAITERYDLGKKGGEDGE